MSEWKKYRKRPIVIEARKATEIERIQTLEGFVTAYPGDYVICGNYGDLYPCKPDIFEKTYDPVEEGDPESLSMVGG